MPKLWIATIECTVAAYNEPVPVLAVMNYCAQLKVPDWTPDEVEQIGTRALNAVLTMNRSRH